MRDEKGKAHGLERQEELAGVGAGLAASIYRAAMTIGHADGRGFGGGF
jgi:hypothetical protein